MNYFDRFLKSKSKLFLLLITLFALAQSKAQNQAVERNSYIINMGITPQTFTDVFRVPFFKTDRTPPDRHSERMRRIPCSRFVILSVSEGSPS
jgi:hypothetical protein